MSPYIYNLTNTLIGNGRYDLMMATETLAKHIQIDLACGAVREMKPETLGKIMGAFETGDVMLTRNEIFQDIKFSGDCEEFLCDIVAICLASVIVNRLLAMPTFPPYKSKHKG